MVLTLASYPKVTLGLAWTLLSLLQRLKLAQHIIECNLSSPAALLCPRLCAFKAGTTDIIVQFITAAAL